MNLKWTAYILSISALLFCSSWKTTGLAVAPILNCPEPTQLAKKERAIQFLSENLSRSDLSLNLADFNCFLDPFNPSPEAHFYDIFTFSVSEEDIYVFELSTSFGGGVAALFEGGFNQDLPCEDLVTLGRYLQNATVESLSPGDTILRMVLPLKPGVDYVLFTSSDGNGDHGLLGNYNWAIYSDGGGVLLELGATVNEPTVHPLICTDVERIIFPNPISYSSTEPIADTILEQLSYTGLPDVSNASGPYQIEVTDQLIQGDQCNDDLILRTFTLTDGDGNSDSCVQEIRFRKPQIIDVYLPSITTALECDNVSTLDANGNPHPAVSGYPFVETTFQFVNLEEDYCSIGATYVDAPIDPTCGSNYDVEREWTLIDRCEPANNQTNIQLLKVEDNTPPEVNCSSSEPLLFSTGPFDCTAAFAVPLPVVSDNCTTNPSILSEIVSGETGMVLAVIDVDATNRMVDDIPVGCHIIRYTVSDECGNSNTQECSFCVEDRIDPVAVCNSSLSISVAAEGGVQVFASTINEGSSDNCGIITLQVRRTVENILNEACLSNFDTNDNGQILGDELEQETLSSGAIAYVTPWRESIDFFCCDIGASVIIELRVMDAAGNVSICERETVIEDLALPRCTPPANTSVACSDLPEDFNPNNLTQLQALFGIPIASDNCEAATWEELSQSVDLDNCGIGTIIRRFRATDDAGNASFGSCQQTVTIEQNNNYELRFPEDKVAFCTESIIDSVQFRGIGCDEIEVSVSASTFTPSGDECYQIRRTYRVINRCEYNGALEPIVVSRDEDCDGVEGEEAVWVLRRENNTFIDQDNSENNQNPFANQKGSSCDGTTNPEGYWRTSPSIGFWEYTQVIKVYDTLAPQVEVAIIEPFCTENNEDCTAAISIPLLIDEDCTPDNLIFTIRYDENSDGLIDREYSSSEILSGRYPDYQLNNRFPVGTHRIEVVVADDCGNSRVRSIPFEIIDCVTAAPLCISGIGAELMPTIPPADVDGDGDIDRAARLIEAIELVASPVVDCNGPITYSVNFYGETPDVNRTSLMLTCDELAEPLLVEVHAWDVAGNNNNCETIILVQDNMGLCDLVGTGSIAGIIHTEVGNPFNGAEVNLSGQMNIAAQTNPMGQFGFNDLEAGYDYSIAPFYDKNHREGVSTFDLVLITKHILGVKPLDSPYKMIAADVNKSGAISTLDLIQLRQIILGIDLEFPNNTSWRFIPEEYVFPEPQNPWAEDFPEVYNINDLPEALVDNVNFIAIKVGDVNLNATSGDPLNVEERNANSIAYLVADQTKAEAGEALQVALSFPKLNDFQALQFTLQFDPTSLTFLALQEALVREEQIGLKYLDDGLITVSWFEENEQSDQDILFKLNFRSKVEAPLKDLISINSRITISEAYYKGNAYQEEIAALELQFISPRVETSTKIELFQNQPNPFSTETSIRFYLPKATTATIKVFNTQSQLIRTIEGQYVKGYHEVVLSKEDLSRAGVFYYTLETENVFLSKKMVYTKL